MILLKLWFSIQIQITCVYCDEDAEAVPQGPEAAGLVDDPTRPVATSNTTTAPRVSRWFLICTSGEAVD
jgi:hypothetical protein